MRTPQQMCSNCHIAPCRPRSRYCSDKCGDEYRATQRRMQPRDVRYKSCNRGANGGTRGRPVAAPHCPVCGDEISAWNDCRCPR